MNYADLATHRVMVRDEMRTAAFQRAIEATVKRGDVVLDLGAGCGILSLFAARAGAARVYAVERNPGVAAFAQALAAKNGFGQVVHAIAADVRAAGIPERVDVIVSEWMGTVGVEENMYGALLWARDNLLAPGGRVIPAAVTAMMAPADPAQRADLGFFTERPYGLDLGTLTEPGLHELLMMRRRIMPENLAAPAQALWTSTAATDTPELVREPLHRELVFRAGKAGAASALALWFEADLGAGVTLSNAPDSPDTHWGQMLLPLDKRHALSKGDRLNVALTLWPVDAGPLMFAWRWQINDGPPLQLDTAGGVGLPAAAAPAAESEAPTKRSDLSRYLAGLAIDPDKLAAFIADPEKAMADLAPDHAEALRSQDPYRIGMAMFDREVKA